MMWLVYYGIGMFIGFSIGGDMVWRYRRVIASQDGIIQSQRAAIEELQEAVHLLAILPDDAPRPDAVIH